MIPRQEEGERGGCRMMRKGGGMVSEGRVKGGTRRDGRRGNDRGTWREKRQSVKKRKR